MKQLFPVSPPSRLTLSICVLVAAVIGLTYALFQSNMTEIQGNTISTATAKLAISADGDSYGDTVPGFTLAGIQPGGNAYPQPGQDVYFKNDGTSPMQLAVNMPDSLQNPQHMDLDKVWLILTPAEGGQALRISLHELSSYYHAGRYARMYHQIIPGQVVHYKLQVQIDTAAIDASQAATLSDVDFIFVGNYDDGPAD